jgi:hypothetical protein
MRKSGGPISGNFAKKARRRRAKARRIRDRMVQTGLMLQMDGSPHHWFGGKSSCLIGHGFEDYRVGRITPPPDHFARTDGDGP